MNHIAQTCFWVDRHLLDHLPAELVTVHLYGKLFTVKAVCREVWLRDISQKVVVVEGLKEPILLVSGDCPFSLNLPLSMWRRAFRRDVKKCDSSNF